MERKRQRTTNWTEPERIALVQNVICNESELFGNFKSSGGSKQAREELWNTIKKSINAEASSQRTVQQIKKQYDNIKQSVKKYIDARKRPKTGGGPPQPPLTISQQLLYDNFGCRQGMSGLFGGLDTDDPQMSSVLVAESDNNTEINSEVAITDQPAESELGEVYSILPNEEISHDADNAEDLVKQIDACTIKGFNLPRRKRARKFNSVEDTFFEAETKRANLECQKLQEEIKLIKCRKIYEKRKFLAEIRYWNAKTKALSSES